MRPSLVSRNEKLEAVPTTVPDKLKPCRHNRGVMEEREMNFNMDGKGTG